MDTKENSTKIVACQLTSPELQKRKFEVVASLKKLVLDRKELADGYQYLFEGKDAVLAEIVEFIKGSAALFSHSILRLKMRQVTFGYR